MGFSYFSSEIHQETVVTMTRTKSPKPVSIFLSGALLAVAMLTSACAPTATQHWSSWRGPSYDGSTKAKNLPVTFSKTSNIVWEASMPGPSAASPIIWGDRVFVSSLDNRTKGLMAICLDRKTGKELWKEQVGIGIQQDNRSNQASPSPVTDWKLVVFFYGNGDLVAFDLAGKKLWQRNIQKDYGQFAFLWTFSTSPVLYENTLFMQVLQRDVPVNGRGRTDGPNESYLLALEPATGKELWRKVRPDEAVSEAKEAFTTPIPFEFKGQKQLIIAGGDYISGHDPKNGDILWSWGTWNEAKVGHWRLVPSPVVGGGVALASAPKKEPVFAVKLGGQGKLPESAVAWRSERNGPISTDVPTPAYADGDFYVLSDVTKKLTRVEAATGKVKWTIDLPGKAKYESSPTVADGKVYTMNFKAEVTVINAADGAVLHTAALGDPTDDTTRSSIAVAGGHLFVRTNAKLYCIGGK
jgi:outer membrane protein assembly factor BamB